MHTFSPISTQYEIESWIFPHPGVRRLQDARNPDPRRHSLHPVTPLTRPSKEREERARLRKGHQRGYSNEHQILHNGLKRKKEDKRREGGGRTGSLRTTLERSEACAQSRPCELISDVPFQTASNSRSRRGGAVVSPSELLSDVPSSHPPHKPWMQTQSTPLPWTGSHASQIQLLLRQPTHPNQQSAAAPRSHPAELEDLLHSLSCKSWVMGADSEPLRGADLPTTSQDARYAHGDTLRDWCGQDTPSQRDAAESDDEEELTPAFLGSLDYHSFLHGSSEAKVIYLPETSPISGAVVAAKGNKSSKTEAALGGENAPRASLKDKHTCQSPVSRLAQKVPQTLSRQPFPGASKPAATILERRRGEALAEKSGRSEALRKLPKPELSVLTEIPASLTFSTISPSSSLTTAPLLREGTLRSISSGPLSTVSSKDIDPERLQPFIGPLLPQTTPPDQPLPQLPLPPPAKRLNPTRTTFASMAGQTNASEREAGRGDMRSSMEQTTERHVNQKKGKGLRKKISRFFSSDQPGPSTDATATTAYQPLSLTTSQDAERLSLSDIFDDVYNAARGSLKPGRGSQSSQNSGRDSYQNTHRVSISSPPRDFLFPVKPENHSRRDPKVVVTTPPKSSYNVEPPLINHPAIRSDLEIQHRLGMSGNSSGPTPIPSTIVRPLEVHGMQISPRRPAQTDSSAPSCFAGPTSSARRDTSKARLVKEGSQLTITAETHRDIDPLPAFDRTVDLTWYRTAREHRGRIICSIPRPSSRFEHVLTLFVAQFAKGRPFKKYDGNKRFPYFELPSKIRFQIVRCLVADTDNARPILLNSQRQASPAWPADAFVSLGSVLRPLQAALWACPRLRAEVMVVLLLTRKFHVIFGPCVRECTQPLPTTWLFRYLHLMQHVSLEIDMTKLGFGHSYDSASMEANMKNICGLVRKFTAEMLTRGSANSMGCLTVHCRRYFGYRQESNTIHGRDSAYMYSPIGGEENEPRSVGSDQPRNYNRKAPSLPPSAAKLYSGHLRHHADLPHRVPYVTEDQLAVASPLRALTGKVESVRMVGFSEEWTYATHLAIWPEAERNAVFDAVKHYHIDRQTPSPHSYAAPGHAVFLDYGFEHGVHRYPPLPDSEPMVCVDYDRQNGLFVELGSGNVVSVTRNGAEFHCRSSDPPTPSQISGTVPGNLAAPARVESLSFVPQPSRIPTLNSRGKTSPISQAMRKGTPAKAAAILGFQMTSSDEEACATPTKPRPIRNNRAETDR